MVSEPEVVVVVSGMQSSIKRRNAGECTGCPTCMGADVPSILSLRPLGRFVPHFRNRATIDCHASLAMTWNAPFMSLRGAQRRSNLLRGWSQDWRNAVPGGSGGPDYAKQSQFWKTGNDGNVCSAKELRARSAGHASAKTKPIFEDECRVLGPDLRALGLRSVAAHAQRRYSAGGRNVVEWDVNRCWNAVDRSN